ncbi:hypothetical protein BAE44_0015165, partial [Dichanthelium oligosanthes]
MEDTLAWAFEKNGVYSVQSAYILLKDEEMREIRASSVPESSSNSGAWWKLLWKMKIPSKVRIFWWRAIHNFLPVKCELFRRHVAKESFCEECGHSQETVFHVAFECTAALRFWQCIREITGKKPPALHPSTWAKDLLIKNVCPANDAALFACCVWSLWTGRNNRRHGNERWNPNAVAHYVEKMIEDLFMIHAKTEQ